MGRVFVTGDKHGDFQSEYDYARIKNFCQTHGTTKEDVVIILGDHGVRYFDDWRDYHAKKKLAKMPIRFVLLRGNHDMRVSPMWKRKYLDEPHICGWFVEDPDFPDILYTEEFGWYWFGGKRVFVINGAYSADKYYRIEMNEYGNKNYRWFFNEQLSDSERSEAQALFLHEMHFGPFSIMSHTCPISFKQLDNALPYVDQELVDETMEKWMEELYDAIKNEDAELDKWYCGHWHVDRTVTPMRFMYHDIIELERERV